MKPRRVDEDTFIFDIPMEGVRMDAIDVTQGGERVYGMYDLIPLCDQRKTLSLTCQCKLIPVINMNP